MIGRGFIQGDLDGHRVAVQVTTVQKDYSGDVLVRYIVPGRLFPNQQVFKHKEWIEVTKESFLAHVVKWSVN